MALKVLKLIESTENATTIVLKPENSNYWFKIIELNEKGMEECKKKQAEDPKLKFLYGRIEMYHEKDLIQGLGYDFGQIDEYSEQINALNSFLFAEQTELINTIVTQIISNETYFNNLVKSREDYVKATASKDEKKD